ncbi:MAG: TIM44-like domain-containing protein [Candidatus Dormibacterales bacterium]
MNEAPGDDPAVALGQIQAADPAFDLETFKRNAVATFLAAKQAIQDRDVIPVEGMIDGTAMDGMREEVSGLTARGAVRHYDGLSPTEVSVVAAKAGPQSDAITLRIRASAVQGLVPEDSGPDWGSGVPTVFTEFWTFSRPPIVSSVAARSECPTCGAPIGIDTGRICRYCGTLLPPPQAESDWMVIAIEPARENTD